MELKQFKNFSSWREQSITIEPFECYHVEFGQTNPNMFYLQNPNRARLHVGLCRIPTDDNYEYLVTENANKAFGKPTGTHTIYIYNATDVKANIILFSLEDEFNIEILESMSFDMDGFSMSLQQSSDIGFKKGVMLPSGNNNIGYVGLSDDDKELLNKLKVAIESLELSTDISNLEKSLSDLILNDDIDGVINLKKLFGCLSSVYSATNYVSTNTGVLVSNSSVNNYTNLVDLLNKLEEVKEAVEKLSSESSGEKWKFIRSEFICETENDEYNYTYSPSSKKRKYVLEYLINYNEESTVVLSSYNLDNSTDKTLLKIKPFYNIADFVYIAEPNNNFTIEAVKDTYCKVSIYELEE